MTATAPLHGTVERGHCTPCPALVPGGTFGWHSRSNAAKVSADHRFWRSSEGDAWGTYVDIAGAWRLPSS